MPGEGEAGCALDLRDRAFDRARFDCGDLAAVRAAHVLVMSAGPLVPSLRGAELDAAKLAVGDETLDRAEDRREVHVEPSCSEARLELVDRPVVAFVTGEQLGEGGSGTWGPGHAGEPTRFCKWLA